MAIKISNSTIIDDDRKIVAAGTVTGESFTPTSATIPTTGIYLSGVNQIAVATNSTLRMSIGSGGIANFVLSPTAPTPATADNNTNIATTAFVKAQNYAPLASPIFTGNPTAPTPDTADNNTNIATTAFVKAQNQNNELYAPLDSPIFTGIPQAPMAAPSTNNFQVATTAFVKVQDYASNEQLFAQGGGIGGYCFVRKESGGTVTLGNLVAGSELRAAWINAQSVVVISGSLFGTWQVMSGQLAAFQSGIAQRVF